MKVSGRSALAGLVGLAWLLLASVGGLGSTEILAGAVATILGAVLVAGWPALGDATRDLVSRGEAWLTSGEAGPPPDPEPEDPEDPDVAGPVAERVLGELARELGGQRMVVWRIDREADSVAAEHCLGTAPPGQPAAGNPLTWAAEEGSALRLDPAPSWSRGDVVAAPIGGERVLTVETAPGQAPEPNRLIPGARILAEVLVLVDREARARGERERLRRVIEFLRGLSERGDPDRVPDSLARAAIDLVGGTAAVVASWAGDEGAVLVREGPGGGPNPGVAFRLGQGDLAHAARVGAIIRRGPGDRPTRPPLAGAEDRWHGKPAYQVVVPLMDTDGDASGVVAVWGERPPAEQGVQLVWSLGPLLSLQLRRSADLAHYRERATADTLTGLENRTAFDERIGHQRARFDRYRRAVSLMVIDVDHFKRVNDTYGHDAGDAVLRAVAARVRGAVRDVDFPFRYGGEELVVLMPETMLRAAEEVAERVRTTIAGAKIDYKGARIPVTVSIGVSSCPECVDNPGNLFPSADGALYVAKEAGRNRVAVAERA